MSMKSWMRFPVCALALFAMAAAHAQSTDSRWQQVKQDGVAEGTVVVAGPAFPGLRDAVIKGFEAETGIKVEWRPLTQGPGPFIAQLSRENNAGRVQTDVYIGGATSCYSMNRLVDATVDLREVLLDPSVVDPANWKNDELSIVRGGPNRPYHHWCALNTAEWVMGDLFVNTRYVKPEDIKSWKDLLDPKFKGKISAHDPRHPGGGRGTAAYLFQLFGGEFLTRLYIGQDVRMHRNYTQAAEDVARGRSWIGIALVQAAVEPWAERGLPIVRVFPEDGPGLLTSGFSGIMKLKGGPHPNAGAVFINWWASKSGQAIAQCELQELSLRKDVGLEDCVPDWTVPKAGEQYLIHSYAPDHYFEYYQEYLEQVPSIFAE